ncbi:carbohydrate ABC transporter permease [Ectopseudomonas mendocina]|uniref:Carbohydrate ABC transporter permease n=1 Tax=Ectopseudomonas mendocina TaxID=300 RepID=A0ABD7RV59_ECTME|nr:carbohydrate ABC transporter permease [Pseudomonas mendocina]TRO11404.1 carbohydrate ABC transporter permease [Pseudomonas mendocina]TRO16750.1 carbohydrate ABC transporter permease [Pseudomonas mendocina]
MTDSVLDARLAPRPVPRVRAFSLSRLAIHATLILACAVYLVPLLVMLLTSFKTPDDIRSGNLLSIPDVFTLIGWVKAWDGVGGYFWNSVKITIPAVLISTLLGALNGYVLAMWRFRGSQLFFGLLLFGCFLPFQVILLPASFTLGQLGLANTTEGLVLVHVVYGLAFTTLFFRNFYVSIPEALVRAARLDGAGFFTIFARILLPMSVPTIMVCLIWQFTQIWNDFLFGVVFASGDTQPITVALNNLVNTSTGAKEYNVDMAAAMIAGLPTLLVYILAGKYFLRGLTAGAVKG